MRIIAEIPARLGSQRVKKKNLRAIGGRPLIEYAIVAAKSSRLIDEVFVNSESNLIGDVAKKLGVSFYKRSEHLATDSATSDEFNFDFLSNVETDLLVMVNPVAPLVSAELIDDMIEHLIHHKLDTLIPVREERLHSFLGGTPINFRTDKSTQLICDDSRPLNFDPKSQLPATPDITPIQVCVWTVCIWRRDVFMTRFREKGSAVFSGRVGLYSVPKIQSIKISSEEDFQLAEALLSETGL